MRERILDILLLIAAVLCVGYSLWQFSEDAGAYEVQEKIISITSNADATEFTPTTNAGFLYGVLVQTDGTNDVTMDLRDGDSGTTTKSIIPTSYVVPTSSEERSEWIDIGGVPVAFNGLYGTASSAGNYTITTYYTEQ